MDENSAKSLALEFLAGRYSRSIELDRMEPGIGEIYDFDPAGWIVFAILGPEYRIGATEVVAVHEETDEVRYLGTTGE